MGNAKTQRREDFMGIDSEDAVARGFNPGFLIEEKRMKTISMVSSHKAPVRIGMI